MQKLIKYQKVWKPDNAADAQHEVVSTQFGGRVVVGGWRWVPRLAQW